ncbi:MAG: DUF2807 domain-containing protein [Bacteroidales bacterium]|nr:DUF2807 domain-containing protein [Bacteroidales bacterium]
MKKIIIASAIVLLTAQSCFIKVKISDETKAGFAALTDDIEYVDSTIALIPDIDFVQVDGNCDCFLFCTDGEPYCEFYGPEGMIINVNKEEGHNSLWISTPRDSSSYISFGRNRKSPTVNVYLPAYSRLSFNGSGDYYTPDDLVVPSLSVTLRGSGDVSIGSVKCDELDIVLSGSGDIKTQPFEASVLRAAVIGSGDIFLNGNSGKADLQVKGSGDINARRLNSSEIRDTVTGSGDIALPE